MIEEFQKPNRWLSNFWLAPQKYDGNIFFCNEQMYCYYKSFDPEYRRKILAATSPGKIKRIGRSITLRTDWNKFKEYIMMEGLKAKFKQNLDLATKLLATGDQILQEGNRWGDTFWGVDLRTMEGENRLGKMLMALRTEMRG